MLTWIVENLGSIATGLFLFGVLALAWKTAMGKGGKDCGGCDGNCDGCGGCRP